jgi:hypothetical protein
LDDQDDRGYSRAPELEDLLSLCIDLLVDASVENVQHLKRAVSGLPDNAIALVADDEIEKYRVVRIADASCVESPWLQPERVT